MAVFGQAVGIYFEEKLQQIFPGQDFPEMAETEETPNAKEKEEDTDDSEEDFIQPRRKRLKAEEKVLHIKWKRTSRETKGSEKLSSSHLTPILLLLQYWRRGSSWTNLLAYLIVIFDRRTVDHSTFVFVKNIKDWK